MTLAALRRHHTVLRNADPVIYNEKGIRQRVACPCPKCREPLTKVLCSGWEDGGEIVRQRKCPNCEHKWFTAQEPEYIVRPELVGWNEISKPILRQTVPAVGGAS